MSRNSQIPLFVRFHHKIFSIDNDIQEDLLYLEGISHDFGQPPVQPRMYTNVVRILFIGTQFENTFDNAVYVHRYFLRIVFSNESKQALEYSTGA